MASKLPFSKIQGCGNDFVVCSRADLSETFLNSPERIQSLCDRHFGIGSDGLMVVDSGTSPYDVQMFNPDGSPMGMCGNGIRCVARYLFTSGILNGRNQTIEFQVSGRRISCLTFDEGLTVKVDMGPPSFDPLIIPIKSELEFADAELVAGGRSFQGWALSMGNPHFVTFVDVLDHNLVTEFGPIIETHSFFPMRTNVEFVKILSRNKVEVGVWERGAGITLACGSGACAAVVAGIRSLMLESDCEVSLPGGSLQVNWDSKKDGASVFLTGPAREVYTGIVSF